ncbi:hypothetical protein H6G20_01560 [Desertifilum sp. FACHB-1129]|uniref:Uncharacterized protein n=1 Tax=Desertifilum tharense IPPAS B-1220 TaxID=1781255 RepID=A0A1E5QFR2_9CYAN|nr:MULTISPECIES: hypothetical protein [Desertifilum]MDA0213308.1 hypothetical protein [Cyanobacteria bacterium FC1]MBD2310369.1 hypothetical protein [Desertifilum sp. FACHB-1129]MBD2321820.1 hypothetical protein [Desertifilum sp. FACHB-866]MBD2331947.1 hypothetical protein [Desertifilum sp. FACHB-868]OEJ73458.1 hypothetical protein BH720_19710 [Desertifilum tharense IPPAS B-1220]
MLLLYLRLLSQPKPLPEPKNGNSQPTQSEINPQIYLRSGITKAIEEIHHAEKNFLLERRLFL